MSLSFGLNTKPKAAAAPPPKKRAPVIDIGLGLDDDSDDETAPQASNNVFEEEVSEFDASISPKRPSAAPPKRAAPKLKPGAPPSKPPVRKRQPEEEYGDLSAQRESEANAKAAVELDSNIYDYDAFHSASTAAASARKAAVQATTAPSQPKYMHNLLSAAAQRKQDQLVAKEKLLQRERETEGDEFADKEKFVTGAYKAQQEENRKLQEEEKRKAEEDEERKKRMGGGMQSFYRGVMADSERRHQEAMEAEMHMGEVVAEEEQSKTDRELAEEMRKKGVNVLVNDEGQVADKRQLLTAGLNVAAKPATASTASAPVSKPAQQNYQKNKFDKGGVRERQTRMMEQQLEASTKRKAEEDEAERQRLAETAKSRKTEGDISDAKARYLARKAEREAAKK